MMEELLLDLQAYVRQYNAGLITTYEFEQKVLLSVLTCPLVNPDLVSAQAL